MEGRVIIAPAPRQTDVGGATKATGGKYDDALGPHDDLTLFEYIKKSNREYGPALVGIELARKEDFTPLLARMDGIGLRYEIISHDSALFRFVL